MERVSDDELLSGELLSDEKLYELAASGDWMKGEDPRIYVALKELQARRKADKEHWHTNPSGDEKTPPEGRTESERDTLPIPCTVGFDDCTVKQWFQKINEELDEFKEAVYRHFDGKMIMIDRHVDDKKIAMEAADTITAITSMCEAMGINEKERQEAQKRANERNRGRGRIAE